MKALLERVITTFVTAAIAVLPATLAFTADDTKAWALTAAGAGLAALIALLKNATFKPTSPVVWINIAERAAWSFVQGAAAALPATLDLANLRGLQAIFVVALVAGGNAILSFAKNLTAAASQTSASVMLNTELGGPAPPM